MINRPLSPAADVEIDMRALFKSVVRALPYLVVLMVIIGAGTYYLLSLIQPTYRSEATVLIETGESMLTRPANAPAESREAIDEETITSQVQLIRSRDLARTVAQKLDLAARPEYQRAVEGRSFFGDLLARFGLASPPNGSSAEEKILRLYYRNLSVYAVEKSRVIIIEFSSTDPQLAAQAANAIAEEYIILQRAAKRDTEQEATRYLEAEIDDLRGKVKEAEAKVETYRTLKGLFSTGGSTPTTLTEQQLADLNAELSRVRAVQAESAAKAAQIRSAISAGAVPNLTDVLNSQLIQRLVEQQVALRAQIAELSATLLPGHPRMRELSAQIAGLNQQIAAEAQKILEALEADTRLSQTREAEILRGLEQLKTGAANANDASVELRALEREASAQRDLLDTYLRRYREAVARQRGEFLPADARIISRAAPAIEPSFPKKVPMTAAAVIAALILGIAFVLIRELVSGRPMREVPFGEPLPVVPDAVPVDGHQRWADDHGIRRMMPSDPTLAPPMPSEVERSLATIAGQIIAEERRRVLVTLAEGADANGRPLAAVALARALARADQRVVLVDLRGDGANSETMGEGPDLPGFADLFAGEASFAQVIFRDRTSRAHFIPSGHGPISADGLQGDRFATIMSALDHTYDHVIVDVGDDLIAAAGPTSDAAMVVTEFGAADPRTVRAVERVTAISEAAILLLVVDAATREPAEREQVEVEPPGEAA